MLAIVIGLTQVSQASGAAGSAHRAADTPRQAQEQTAAPRVAPEKCPSARRAVTFYARRLTQWRAKTGAGSRRRTYPPAIAGDGAACPRYLAHVLQRKARAAHRAYDEWYFREWRWDHWLPAKWYRIARCETGVRWDWNSGAYQGAFGFAVSSWDAFRLAGYPSEAYLATPRQQYQVALAIWRRFGFSGWGCRNA